ncbi:MAG: DUF5668 domain-containing protein [candidate division Zixibacteria bacterium]|nr:DUF5668 domain-containing protein [candidate division Zixibacteria bacterium]
MADRKRSIFTGIILVIIGLLFLLDNLGYISGNIWRFWPLILIILGIKKLIF